MRASTTIMPTPALKKAKIVEMVSHGPLFPKELIWAAVERRPPAWQNVRCGHVRLPRHFPSRRGFSKFTLNFRGKVEGDLKIWAAVERRPPVTWRVGIQSTRLRRWSRTFVSGRAAFHRRPDLVPEEWVDLFG